MTARELVVLARGHELSLMVVAVLLAAGVATIAGWREGRRRASSDAAVVAARESVARADGARRVVDAAVREAHRATARVAHAGRAPRVRADSLRVLLRVRSATALELRATPDAEAEVVTVPPLVVRRIEADQAALAAADSLIGAQGAELAARERQHEADSVAIAARDALVRALERRRGSWCGRRCGIAIGVGAAMVAARLTRR